MKFLVFAWLAGVVLAGLKMVIDQYKLLKLYRTQVNPPCPILPGEVSNMFEKTGDPKKTERFVDSKDPLQLKITSRRFRIAFSKHNDHPDVARLARLVRADFYTALGVGFGGFGLIVLLLLAFHRP